LPSKALRGTRCCAGQAREAGRTWNVLGAVAALDGLTPRRRTNRRMNLIKNRVELFSHLHLFQQSHTTTPLSLTTKHTFRPITCCASSHKATTLKQTHLQQNLQNRTKHSAVAIFHDNSHSANDSHAGIHICILCGSFTSPEAPVSECLHLTTKAWSVATRQFKKQSQRILGEIHKKPNFL
jgi:hypothetical protein